jgi:hypothetical protein
MRGKGRRDVTSGACFEHAGEQAFDERDDVVALNEAGLDVDLRELGLAVGAQVFVAEAAGDLEVALQTGHHHELLVLLRSLRQRVELAGVQTGGHEEVAGAFRRRVAEDRRFDFDEACGVEVVARGVGDLVARADVLVHALAAQVEVAVFHPQILVGQLTVELEGQHVGLVEHFAFGGDDFDIAGGQLGVFRARETRGDLAGDL